MSASTPTSSSVRAAPPRAAFRRPQPLHRAANRRRPLARDRGAQAARDRRGTRRSRPPGSVAPDRAGHPSAPPAEEGWKSSRPLVAPATRARAAAARDRAAGGASAPLAGPSENDPVVQAKLPVLPELDFDRLQAVAAPVGGPGHLAVGELVRVVGDRLLQFGARFERSRLLAGPGADAAFARPAGEIGVRPRPRPAG